MPVFYGAINGQYETRLHIAPGTQEIANNRTRVDWSLRGGKNSGTGYWTGNPQAASVVIDGVTVWSGTWTYDFTGGVSEVIIAYGWVWVDHNADGTKTVAASGMATMFNPPGGTGVATGNTVLTAIPRATAASLPGTVNVGSATTINTPRPSGTSFVHTLQLWEYGGTSSISTIATGVTTSHSWTPPLSLATYFPNGTSKQFFIRCITYASSGGAQIGVKDTVFSLAAPSSMVPSISAPTVAEQNATVASQIGAYVQGQSVVKVTVNSSGVQGSSITSRTFKVGSSTLSSGSNVGLASSGTVGIQSNTTDSRGRTATATHNISVLAYTSPKINSMLVRRALSNGTVNDSGTYLRLDLNAVVQSLIVSAAQKNAMTIRVFTRQKGGSVWTARNVITPGLTYATNVLITGGGVYGIEQSWEVRVEVADKLMGSAAQTVVATSAVFMHWGQGLGVGKFWEQGALDVAGDIYSSGNLVVHRGNLSSGLWGNGGGGNTQLVPNSDCNQAIDTGFYFAVNPTHSNTPPEAGWWNITVENSGSRSTQYATNIAGIGSVWKRWRDTPATPVTWTAWQRVGFDRVASQAEVNAGTLAYVPVASDTLRNRNYAPWAEAAGISGNIASTGNPTQINFPSGRFTVAPIVVCVPHAPAGDAVSVCHVPSSEITTTGFTVSMWTLAAARIAGTVRWHAVQMASGSASG